MKIYVVDSDEGTRSMLLYVLGEQSYTASGFETADSFKAALRTELPNLILLDSVMTEKEDGLTLLKWLKADRRTVISHSIFNITGAIVFACLIRPFAAFITYISPSGNEVDVIARQIANAHTGFNIVYTLIWPPLLPVMVKLVTTIIPGKDKLPQTDCKPKFWDEKLLSSGVLTESQSEQTAGLLYVSNNIDRMTEYSRRGQSVGKSFDAAADRDV